LKSGLKAFNTLSLEGTTRLKEKEGMKFVPGQARLKEKCAGRTWNQSSAAGRRFYAF